MPRTPSSPERSEYPLGPLEEFVAPFPTTAIVFGAFRGRTLPVFLRSTVDAAPMVRIKLSEEGLSRKSYKNDRERVHALFVVGLHVDVRTLAGVPGVEVDGGEAGVLAKEVPTMSYHQFLIVEIGQWSGLTMRQEYASPCPLRS